MGTQSWTNPGKFFGALALFCACGIVCVAQTAVPLLSPAGLAFDAVGGVYIAETGRHLVDRYDPATGNFTVVAGDGTQGFSGDGGPATAAELDSPVGLAIDSAGNLYIADSHNQRVRMVASGTGTISTVAGTGVAGFSGDGGTATQARMSLPMAVAVDASGALYIADAGNHRIRRVVSGVISTVAGSVVEGDAGDGGPATAAALDAPGGLAVDASGNLYIADTHNHRVRVVSSATGVISAVAGGLGLPKGLSLDASGNVYVADAQGHRVLRIASGVVTTVAGSGVEGFAGDGGPATVAMLDGPKTAGVSPAGLVTLADTHNQRVRQIDASGNIHTLEGTGVVTGILSLNGPSTALYGTGSVAAQEAGATGSVTLYEVTPGVSTVLGSAGLNGGTATFTTANLAAGMHRLQAVYSGDETHAPTESSVVTVTISPAPLSATAEPVSMLYGQSVPSLTGMLTGVLQQDAGKVSAIFTAAATSLSSVGSYPIAAELSGSAAGNYTVSTSGSLTIAPAGTTSALSTAVSTVTSGSPLALSAKVVSTTQGIPTGKVSFLDGGVTLTTAAVDSAGVASFSPILGVGIHTITAVYAGDTNFLGSTAPAFSAIITPQQITTPDFALSSTGGNAQTVVAGSAASFAFGVSLSNGNLSGPIVLAATGVPTGATASFSPAVIPPGGAVTSFTLTIQTLKPAAITPVSAAAFLFGVWVLCVLRRKRRAALFGLIFLAGCGDRVASIAGSGSTAQPVSYPITVTGTSTSATGAILQHTAIVTLTVQ